jgi:uncharacterized glyoxalase superfamily protein PhnB
MSLSSLKPFVPAGIDFARAREPTDYPWGQREVHLVDPAGVCWHFA